MFNFQPKGVEMTSVMTATRSRLSDEIDRIRGEIVEAELLSMTDVRNALLDLRLAADSDVVKLRVDDMLANIPGRGLVKTQWLRDQLLHVEADA